MSDPFVTEPLGDDDAVFESGGDNIIPDVRREHKRDDGGPAGKGADFEVTVSDPEKKGDGVYAYVTYKVNTKVSTGDGQFSHSSVIRRYSDFAWLHQQLTAKNPGWLIPPLPEKAYIGRFSPMFVDSRRRGLELFLNRIAKHAQLCQSDDVHLFLHGGQEFNDAREGKVVKKKASAKGFLDYLGELSQSMSNTFSSGKDREKSEDDVKCDVIEQYAESLDETVGNVHKQIVVLTKRTKDIANAWFDFGFACTLLGQYETEQEEPKLGQAFAKLGKCADRLSVLLQQSVDTQVVHFEEPFHDFLRTVGAVKAMLKSRASVVLAYQTALSNLEAKQAQLTKLQGKGKESRAQAVETEVVEAQQLVDERLHEVQRVTERVFAETARFREEKRVSFKNSLLDFVRMQIESAKKVQKAWESVLPELEALPFGEDDTE